MIGKVFELTSHPLGPFKQWSRPYLGQVTFMNKSQNISVLIKGDLDYFSDTNVLIIVQFKDGRDKSVTKTWPGDKIAQIPYDIVHTVYNMIDEINNDGDDEGDANVDPSPVINPELVPVG